MTTKLLQNVGNIDSGFSFSCDLSGEIISKSDGITELLNRYEIYSNNVYELLEVASNCNSMIIQEIKSQISAGKAVIDVILKFKCSPMLILLSFFRREYLNQGRYTVINCISREIVLPTHCKMMFQSSELIKSSIATIKANLDSGKIKLSAKEMTIMFLLSSGFVQDKIATLLGYSRSYIATVISRDLCPKFGIVGSSTILLTEIALSLADFQRQIPEKVADIFQAVIL